MPPSSSSALESQEGAGGYAQEQSEDFLATQRELIGNEVAASDVVITTAADPGPQGAGPRHDRDGRAHGRGIGRSSTWPPTRAATASCRSRARTSIHHGVTVVGLTNPPSSMPTHASFLYSRNVANFLGLS